jgi:hypothetical protein
MNDQWKIWFAEHLARGSAEEYLAQIMLNQNVPLANIWPRSKWYIPHLRI